MRWFLVISLTAILAIDVGVAYVVEEYEMDTYTNYHQKEKYQSKTLQGPFIIGTRSAILWFVNFADRNDKAITALSTFVIAIFTIVLAFATGILVKMARQQDEATRVHERAYVFGGPGMRVLSAPEPVGRVQAIMVTIANYGRTPAFLRNVSWGLCLERDWPMHTYQHETNREDVIFPNQTGPQPYAHAQSPIPIQGFRNTVHIFYGRIDYLDVFKKEHHSFWRHRILPPDWRRDEPLAGLIDEWD